MPLNVGIIGLGVGESHIEGYTAAGAKVVALCDFDQEKLQGAASRHPSVTATYLDADALLDDPAIDVVSIASYDKDHCRQVLRGLESGKHLFVEKPLCVSAEEARSIRSLMKKHPSLRLSSNLALRASPRFIKVRDLVESGEFGNLYHVEADYLYGRIEKLLTGWRGQDPAYSVTLGGGIHVIDLLLWLTQDQVVEVRAIGTQVATKGSQIAFPDTVTALLSFKSGMTGKVSSNFPCVHPHFHTLNLFGNLGTFQNDFTEGKRFTSRGTDSFVSLPEAYRPAGKHLLVTEFIREIQGDPSNHVSVESIFQALSVCFAIDTSLKTGVAVVVEYL